MRSGDSGGESDARAALARLHELYPGRWAVGLIRLCGPSAHTHRHRDGVERECEHPGKRPLDLGWQRAAAERYAAGADRGAHLAAIARHLAGGGNVGLALPSGVVALDADTSDAAAWLDTALPDAPAQQTARGLHELARVAGDPRNTVRVPIADWIEIDVRGVGAQIVVEPSIHATGAFYTWLRTLPRTRAELPECPFPLPISGAPREREPKEQTSDGESIRDGERNSALASLAGTMRRRGMSADAIYAALACENTARCRPPLPDAEVRRVADSVARYAPEESERRKLVRQRRAQITSLADVAPERTEWLWRGRIPRGAVTIIDGDPDLGKSTVTLDLAARVSTGRPMPDNSAGIGPADVIVVTYEDHLAATIRPRLDAAGADVARVHALSIATEHGPDAPELPADLAALAEAIREKGAALVIVDPLMAALGGSVDAHRDQDVRRVLAPLARNAEEYGCAILAVRHLRKSGGSNPLYAGGGSVGIVAAVRSALLVARDPQDPDRRVLARAKCNLAAPVPSLGYRLVVSGDVARVEWLGTVEATAGDLLAAAADTAADRGAVEVAREVMLAEIAAGRTLVSDVDAAVRRAGVSTSARHRAARELGIRSHKIGFGRAARNVYSMRGNGADAHGADEHDEHGQTAAESRSYEDGPLHARQAHGVDAHGDDPLAEDLL